jgi:hypothetical protein
MYKALLFLCLAACLQTPALAQDKDLAELVRINRQFNLNWVNGDTVAHTRIIHRDFLCVLSSRASTIDRLSYMQGWAPGAATVLYWDYRAERIRVVGNIALVMSINVYKVRVDDKIVEKASHYTDTYLKENGQWRCVQAQLAEVPLATATALPIVANSKEVVSFL